MGQPARRVASVLSGTLLLTGLAGCGGADPKPDASGVPADKYRPATDAATSAPATAPTAAGRTYTLPSSICAVADLTAITELYPTFDGKPLADSSGVCTRFLRSAKTVVVFTVDPQLAGSAKFGQEFLNTGRRLAKTKTTDLPGVGTDAYWTVDRYEVKVVTYDGNLILEVSISLPNKGTDALPADTPQRLGRVANGTFAKLAR
ncbi:hypothetical protein [Micromonospora zhanjiangensis]|uniref:DUF3558 domain-containing protein n=1 Tax=Micromonospora zhanjiangensis TaxID=1522057 RepID=A0ABV8KM53_9ACTN